MTTERPGYIDTRPVCTRCHGRPRDVEVVCRDCGTTAYEAKYRDGRRDGLLEAALALIELAGHNRGCAKGLNGVAPATAEHMAFAWGQLLETSDELKRRADLLR